MDILQTKNFTRNTNSQTTVYTPLNVPLVHVLMARSTSRFSKVDSLIIAISVTDHGETTPSNTRVVHADDADAKGCSYQCICSVTLSPN